MRSLPKIAAWMFIAGSGLLVFGGSNILFSAESDVSQDIGLLIKVITWIGIIMIILSMAMFGLATMLTSLER